MLLGKAKRRKKILKKILSDFFGIKFWNLLGLTSNFEFGRTVTFLGRPIMYVQTRQSFKYGHNGHPDREMWKLKYYSRLV